MKLKSRHKYFILLKLSAARVKLMTNKTIKDFWDYDENSKISLSPHKYKYWLEQNNFFKYFPADTDTADHRTGTLFQNSRRQQFQ